MGAYPDTAERETQRLANRQLRLLALAPAQLEQGVDEGVRIGRGTTPRDDVPRRSSRALLRAGIRELGHHAAQPLDEEVHRPDRRLLLLFLVGTLGTLGTPTRILHRRAREVR